MQQEMSTARQLYQTGKLRDAKPLFAQVVAAQPANVEALWLLGLVCQELGQYDEAITHYQAALKIQPNQAALHNNLANALLRNDRHDEAMHHVREAIRLDPHHANAYCALGNVYFTQNLLDEALAYYQQALTLDPNLVEAYNGLGAALQGLGRFDQAANYFWEAIRRRPKFAEAHKNLGMTWLQLGDFQRGGPEYEWRRGCADWPFGPPGKPDWDGSPLAGRSILICCEQGLGDTLQFIRFAPLVAARGGKLIVACQPPLLPILSLCKGIDQLLPTGKPPPPFDVYAPLLSMLRLFGTTPETVPANIPYLFAEPSLVDKWRQELDEACGAERGASRLRIGIAWKGSAAYRGDKRRSMPLRAFASLAQIEGVRLISLQKGDGTEQIPECAAEVPVLDLGPRLDETTGAFMDTAAVLKNLDLLIAADTAVAHLAGGLGVPTWLAQTIIPDWRWIHGRTDSPWYPRHRLFRQTSPGDWSGVFQRIAAALREYDPQVSEYLALRRGD